MAYLRSLARYRAEAWVLMAAALGAAAIGVCMAVWPVGVGVVGGAAAGLVLGMLYVQERLRQRGGRGVPDTSLGGERGTLTKPARAAVLRARGAALRVERDRTAA